MKYRCLAGLVALLLSYVASGCELTVEQLKASAKRDRAIEEHYVSQLFRTADRVVIGTVSEVSVSSDRLSEIGTISVERTLKGPHEQQLKALTPPEPKQPPVKSANLDGTMQLSSIPSCDEPYDPSKEKPLLSKGWRGLFYISKGVIVREVLFPIEPQLMGFDANVEIAFLAQRIK
jgi:hypothetical protein